MNFKNLFLAITLGATSFAPIAFSQAHTIIVHVPNRAGSKITFTTERGSCGENQMLVYSQSEGGKMGFTGCYRLIDSELFVIWADGDVYTYAFNSLVFTEEFKDYFARGEK